MKVKELIEKLQTFNPELEVFIQEADYDFDIIYNNKIYDLKQKYTKIITTERSLVEIEAVCINPMDDEDEG